MADMQEKFPPVIVREDGTIIRLRKLPLRIRILHRIEDYVDDINWLHVAFKICAYGYAAFLAFLTWQVLRQLPWSGQSDKVPLAYQDFAKYLEPFDGGR
jgi:hypothetical protein